jgi:hypothetical protein
MKAKKAIKRLHRVETLLGSVIEQYDAGAREVHELLDAARSSVASATQALAPSPAKKPPAKADQPQAPALSAKRGRTVATRKGMTTLAGKRSRKTA